MYTAIATGRVVLPLGGWVLFCTLAVKGALHLAGGEDLAGTPHWVGLACGVFAWVLHLLCEQVQEEED